MSERRTAKAWAGLHADRLSREPQEAAYAAAWERLNRIRPGQPTPLLDWLLGDGCGPFALVTDRDQQVAGTVIQWLGSSVGQEFLADVKKHGGRR